jgi:hypothetical protein
VRKAVVKLWSTDPGLSVLLWSLVVIIFVVRPLVDARIAGGAVIEVGFGLILLAGVWTVWSRRGQAMVLTAMVVLAEIVRWVSRQRPDAGLAAWEPLAGAVAIGILVLLILHRVFQEGPVTRQRIEGAVAVYLLVALMWAELFQFLEALKPGSFQLPSGGDGLSDRFSPLLYFSFITLTTLGYGDIVPVAPAARSLAMVEALIGQLYPAILIARLVSLQITAQGKQPK